MRCRLREQLPKSVMQLGILVQGLLLGLGLGEEFQKGECGHHGSVAE